MMDRVLLIIACSLLLGLVVAAMVAVCLEGRR